MLEASPQKSESFWSGNRLNLNEAAKVKVCDAWERTFKVTFEWTSITGRFFSWTREITEAWSLFTVVVGGRHFSVRKYFFQMKNLFIARSIEKKVQTPALNSQRLVACSKIYQNSLKCFGSLQGARNFSCETWNDVSKSTLGRPRHIFFKKTKVFWMNHRNTFKRN